MPDTKCQDEGYSPSDIALVVVEVLNKQGYHFSSGITSSSNLIYGVGGCGCGCSSDFQMYYDSETGTLAIVPPLLSDNLKNIRGKESELAGMIKQRKNKLKRVDLVLSENPNEWPDYLKKYARKQLI